MASATSLGSPLTLGMGASPAGSWGGDDDDAKGAIEGSLFRVLRVMTEQKRLGNGARLLRYAVMIASFLQTLVLVCQPRLGWDAEDWGFVQWAGLLKLVVPRAASLDGFLVAYVPAVVAVWLALADALYVLSSLNAPSPNGLVWPIRALRVLVTLLLSAGFLPVMTVLLVPFSCELMRQHADEGFGCGSGVHSALIVSSVSTLLVLVPAAILLALTHHEDNPLSGNPIARPSSRVDCAETVTRTVLVVSVLFLSSSGVVAFLMTALTGVHAALLIIVLPYYSSATNERRAALAGGLFWLAAASLVVVATGAEAGSDLRRILTGVGAGAAPIFGVACAMAARRRYRWLRGLALRIRAGVPAEHARRHAAWQAAEAKSTPSAARRALLSPPSTASAAPTPAAHAAALTGDMTLSECVTKHLVFETDIEVMARAVLQEPDAHNVARANMLFNDALLVFPGSLYLRLQYCTFLQLHRRGTLRSMSLLQEARRFDGAIDLRYARWSRIQAWQQSQQTQSIGGRSLDIVSVISFLKAYNSTLAHHVAALRALRDFWAVLSGRLTDDVGEDSARILTEKLHKLQRATRSAQRGYSLLMPRFPKSDVLRQSFGLFLYNVLHDEARAAKYMKSEAVNAAAARASQASNGGRSPAALLRAAMPALAGTGRFDTGSLKHSVSDVRVLLRRFITGLVGLVAVTLVVAVLSISAGSSFEASLGAIRSSTAMERHTIGFAEAARELEQANTTDAEAAAVGLLANTSAFDAAFRAAFATRGDVSATVNLWREETVPVVELTASSSQVRLDTLNMFDASALAVEMGATVARTVDLASISDATSPSPAHELWGALMANVGALLARANVVGDATRAAVAATFPRDLGVAGVLSVATACLIGVALVAFVIRPAHLSVRTSYERLATLAQRVPQAEAHDMYEHYDRLYTSFALREDAVDEEPPASPLELAAGEKKSGEGADVVVAPAPSPVRDARAADEPTQIFTKTVPFPGIDSRSATHHSHESGSEASWQQSPGSTTSEAEDVGFRSRSRMSVIDTDARPRGASDGSSGADARCSVSSPASESGSMGRSFQSLGAEQLIAAASRALEPALERTAATTAPTEAAPSEPAPATQAVAAATTEGSVPGATSVDVADAEDVARTPDTGRVHRIDSRSSAASASAATLVRSVLGSHDSALVLRDASKAPASDDALLDADEFDGDLLELAARRIEDEAVRAAARVHMAARAAISHNTKHGSARSVRSLESVPRIGPVPGTSSAGRGARQLSATSVRSDAGVSYQDGAPRISATRASLTRHGGSLSDADGERSGSEAGASRGSSARSLQAGSVADMPPMLSPRTLPTGEATIDVGEFAYRFGSSSSPIRHGFLRPPKLRTLSSLSDAGVSAYRHVRYLLAPVVLLLVVIPAIVLAGVALSTNCLSHARAAAEDVTASSTRALAVDHLSFVARELYVGDERVGDSDELVATLSSFLLIARAQHEALRLRLDEYVGTDEGDALEAVWYGASDPGSTSGMHITLRRFLLLVDAATQLRDDEGVVVELREIAADPLRRALLEASGVHEGIVTSSLRPLPMTAIVVVVCVVVAAVASYATFRPIVNQVIRSSGTLALLHNVLPPGVEEGGISIKPPPPVGACPQGSWFRRGECRASPSQSSPEQRTVEAPQLSWC